MYYSRIPKNTPIAPGEKNWNVVKFNCLAKQITKNITLLPTQQKERKLLQLKAFEL